MVPWLRGLVLVWFAGLAWLPAMAQPDIGVVLMHGKGDRPPSNVMQLARRLQDRGFRVLTPDMAWSGLRAYDVSYPQTLQEIDDAARRLRQQGATRIVVGGLSFGANAALAYVASGRAVAGVFALSPGHTPERGRFREGVASSVEKARAMVAGGEGGSRAWFDDINQRQTSRIRTTAEVYLSYFEPDGLGNMQRNLAGFARPVPVFMAVGTGDPIAAVARESLFDRAPAHAASQYVVLPADHIGLANVVDAELIGWLEALPW